MVNKKDIKLNLEALVNIQDKWELRVSSAVCLAIGTGPYTLRGRHCGAHGQEDEAPKPRDNPLPSLTKQNTPKLFLLLFALHREYGSSPKW